jgi:hypothetical protein
VVSDDARPGDPNPAIDQILDAGTFYLTVSSGGAGTSSGGYALVTLFTPLSPEMRDQLPDLNPEAHAGIRGDLTALATADFNRDNIMDLAVADRGRGLVWQFRGLGETNFAPPMRYELPGRLDALEVQDFNSDGRTDFAVLDRTAGIVTIVVGFGDGTFSLSSPQQLPANHPAFSGLFVPGGSQMVGVDINRDGFTDRISLQPSAAGDVVLSLAVRIPAESDALIEVPWAPQPIPVQPFLGGFPLFVPRIRCPLRRGDHPEPRPHRTADR